MKTMKKLLAVLLAVSVVMSYSFVVFADTTKPGKITVSNATIGATYTPYKVFDATYTTDATTGKKNVAYTYTKNGTTDDFLVALQSTTGDPASPFDVKQVGTTNTYTVSKKSTASEENVVNFLTKYKSLLTAAKTGVAATSTTVTFTDLDLGYYLVTSTVNKDANTPDKLVGSVVSLDTTLPEVVMFDKNQGPTWTNPPGKPLGEDPGTEPDDPGHPTPPTPSKPGVGKAIIENKTAVEENTVKIGDEVTFRIAFDATAYAGDKLITHYFIKDTLSNAFTLTPATATAKNPTVSIIPYTTSGTLDKANIKTLDASTSDTINTSNKYYMTTDTTTSTGNTIYNFTIPFGEIYGTAARIVVEYKAKLNDTAVIGDTGNLNKANFTYGAKDYDPNLTNGETGYIDPDNPSTFGDPVTPGTYDPANPDEKNPGYDPNNEVNTKTHTYAIGIKKVDPEKKDSNNKPTPLAGAEFSFNKPVVEAKDSSGTVIPGVYIYNPASGASTNTTLKTNSDGLLIIKGLEDTSSASTDDDYILTETKAPTGYNLATDPFNFDILTSTDSTTGAITLASTQGDGRTVETILETQVVSAQIDNYTGNELPSTGGIGTKIFYILGTILALGAAIVLITRRRMNAR